jgi:AraC-like DNA-binding protein
MLNIPGFHLFFKAPDEISPARRNDEKLHVNEESLTEIMRIFNNILDEQNNLQSGSMTFILTSFIQLILLVCRKSNFSDNRYYGYSHQISKAINYMENNYSQKITLANLAEVSGLSGSSFRRCFHNAVGLSPINYLLKLRLRKAAVLLDTGDLSISEIAYKTGFSDSNYFIRQFKKFTGVTPLKYRAGNHGIFYIPKH